MITALGACGNNEPASGTSSSGSSSSAAEKISGEFQGAGASSQQSAVEAWIASYQEQNPDAKISYNPSGSGAGVSTFLTGATAWAGSDASLSDDEVSQSKSVCASGTAFDVPVYISPIAIVFNLKGISGKDKHLNLDGETIAKIFDGKITKWNDPAIAEVNEGVELPDTDISVVYRSEESGTTDNFMKFLTSAAPEDWEHEASKSFPTANGQGANGSAGVVDQVAQVPGAITYVEAGFAKDKDLGIAKMDFGNGPVELNADTVGTALDQVEFSGEGNDMVVDAEALFAMDAEGAYPLVLTTYEVVCSAGYDETTRDLVKNFFKIVLEEGQSQELEDLGYIPVQGEFKQKLVDAVDAIQ